MTTGLKDLANRLGVLTSFWDGGLVSKEYVTSDKTIKFMADVLGYSANTDTQVAKSIEKFDNKIWLKVLEESIVRKQYDIYFDITLLKKEFDLNVEVFVVDSNKKIYSPKIRVSEIVETKEISKKEYVKFYINILEELPIGYYKLEVRVGSKSYYSKLALAPKRSYEKENTEKLWGFALQLYALKSKRNWGVGDFTDLANFVDLAAKNGADLIGLNPLNVLSHDYPENASPYASTSRMFLNPIYIDVENLPEYDAKDFALVKDYISKARKNETILYDVVYPSKIKVLEVLYDRFLTSKDKKRTEEFERFCKEQGEELNKLATFQALYEVQTRAVWGGWKAWEKDLQTPNSVGVLKFAKENKKRIGFFKFLQFEADRQLKIAYSRVLKSKMKVGFYRDLAVGVGQDSAEFWSDVDGIFMKNVGAGAPPDAFFPAGQKWGLGAFDPFRLRELGYEPFIKVLRANMAMSGALRIDHVMLLTRLYIIPEKLEEGTYLHYNFEDMLNIVAIESHLNKCMIVGESIGNVPAGFLERLEETNIKSLSVLWAERYDSGWGDFRPANEYPFESYVSIGTHDMAPLRMWWFGYDIEVSYSLKLIPNEVERSGAYSKRENDRIKLLKALDSANVWPIDNMRKSDYIYGDGYPEGLEEALHKFMASTSSKTFLASLEDILHVEKMQNLPGTDRDKHPNWRRKLPVDLEDLEKNILFKRNMKVMAR